MDLPRVLGVSDWKCKRGEKTFCLRKFVFALRRVPQTFSHYCMQGGGGRPRPTYAGPQSQTKLRIPELILLETSGAGRIGSGSRGGVTPNKLGCLDFIVSVSWLLRP